MHPVKLSYWHKSINTEPDLNLSKHAGLARKRKQKEEAAKEQAIEAGMMQRKGLAKKRKQAEKAQKKGLKRKGKT